MVEDLGHIVHQKKHISAVNRIEDCYHADVASADTYMLLSCGFRVADNTVAKVVRGICQAVYDCYHSEISNDRRGKGRWSMVSPT
jgi:hypothetical protein